MTLPSLPLPARIAIAGAVAALAIAAAWPARAALGGTAASVVRDQGGMHATMRSMPGRGFTVHELVAPSRTAVREYAAPSGVVFAVAWEGPSQPDLRQLLGSYFPQYVDALARRRTRRAPVEVALPGLVVRAGGHMRAFSGKAWLPAELPSGVTPAEIR